MITVVAWTWMAIQIKPEAFFSEIRVEGFTAENQETPPFAALGFLDLAIHFEKLHELYLRNTRKLEDQTYSRKKINLDSPTEKSFDLVYRHWLLGKLFTIRESHQKTTLGDASLKAHDTGFKGLAAADVWLIHKRLLLETKSRLVGNAFNDLDANLAFIDLGNQKSRVYVFFEVEVVDVKSTKDVKAMISSFLSDLRELK